MSESPEETVLSNVNLTSSTLRAMDSRPQIWKSSWTFRSK